MTKHAIALLLFCLLLVSSMPGHASAVIALPDPTVIDDMLGRMNDLRARRGLPPYALNAQLNAAAQDQANWLVETGIRTHHRPDGVHVSDRVAAAGYTWDGWCCGENYYMSIDATPDMVWDFWVYSPSHYVNLTHRDFNQVGVGMATNGHRHSYVLVFARSSSGAPVVAVEEAPPHTLTVPGTTHRVRLGETLALIADLYNTTVTQLTTINNISNANLIMSGAVFSISGTAVQREVTLPQEPAQHSGQYVVQPGDNLYRIALNHGTDYQTLAAVNEISDPRLIYTGQVIMLP